MTSSWYETGSIPVTDRNGKRWQWLKPDPTEQIERVREKLRKRQEAAEEAMAIASIKEAIKKRGS